MKLRLTLRASRKVVVPRGGMQLVRKIKGLQREGRKCKRPSGVRPCLRISQTTSSASLAIAPFGTPWT